MSCHIRWDSSETSSFLAWTKELLHDSLNSGKRPHILSSEINIENLSFGDNAPEFEILEIGDLADDRFRGIFKLKYDGDAQIRLSTSIQANLLNILEKSTQEMGGDFALPKFPLAAQPFSIPLFVNLSQIRLSGIIVVVFSKSKGLTLVFKNDPLENIKVSSSFDNVQVIEKFLQNKIENQIRDLFRDVLPSVLHKVSQKWTTSNILSQLHSKLNGNDSISNKVEKVSIFEVNPSEPEISPANMLRLSTLTTSRLSFRISVDPLPEVIERPSLFKYQYNFKQVIGNNSKNLPIEIITNIGGSELDTTLNQITKIQSKIYMNEKNSSKPKRRTIKFGSKKKQQQKQPQKQEQEHSEIQTQVSEVSKVELSVQDSKQEEKHEIVEVKRSEDQKLIPSPHIQSMTFGQSQTPSPLSSRSSSLSFSKPNYVELYSPNPILHGHTHGHTHGHPLITPLKTDHMFLRSTSPRKSQSNLMLNNIGIGGYFHMRLDSPPPPPYM